MPPPSLFLNLSDALWWDSSSTAFSRREDHRLDSQLRPWFFFFFFLYPRCKHCSQKCVWGGWGREQETIPDQTQQLTKLPRGCYESNKRSPLLWFSDVSEAVAFTQARRSSNTSSPNRSQHICVFVAEMICKWPDKHLLVNCSSWLISRLEPQ